MREHGFRCRTVQISVRDNELFWFERQAKLPKPSYVSNDITAAAMKLFHQHYRWDKPIRSIGVRATDLVPESNPLQTSIFENEEQREKLENLDKAVDSIRSRFGHYCIQRASVLADSPLCGINPKGDHIIHPVGYFKDGSMK
jgi:DNA polymerase-4